MNELLLNAVLHMPEPSQAPEEPDTTPQEPEKPKVPAFSMTAYTGGIMSPANMPDRRFVLDISGIEFPPNGVPAKLEHIDASTIGVGWVDRIQTTPGQVAAFGRITRTNPYAQEVVSSAKAGHPWQASLRVRWTPEAVTRIPKGKTITVNGRELAGPFDLLSFSTVREISICELAADPDTTLTIAASAALDQGTPTMPDTTTPGTPGTPGSTEDSNLSTKAPEDAAFSVSDDIDEPDYLEDARNRARQKNTIEELCRRVVQNRPEAADKVAELRFSALGGDLPLDQLRARLNKLSRAPEFSPNARQKMAEESAQIMECAFMQSEGFDAKKIDALFGDRIQQKAWNEFGGKISIQKAMREIASGRAPREGMQDTDLLFRIAMADPNVYREAQFNAYSNVNLSTLLSNVANKFVADRFESNMELQQSWRAIAKTRPVNDYKTNTGVKLSVAQGMKKVPNTGEIPHTTLAEADYTVKADTYGMMVKLGHETIANDDLGELADAARQMTDEALDDLAYNFWKAFMDNSAFFTAARGNYIQGSTTNLSYASLGSAVALFRKQTKPNGRPLMIEPTYLIVPPELEVEASQLYTSTNMVQSGGSTKSRDPDGNIYFNKFKPMVVPFLSHSDLTGNSAKAWYLAGPGQRLPLMVVAFKGPETPVFRTAEPDFNQLGVQMRVTYDWGISRWEYRGGVKSLGEAE